MVEGEDEQAVNAPAMGNGLQGFIALGRGFDGKEADVVIAVGNDRHNAAQALNLGGDGEIGDNHADGVRFAHREAPAAGVGDKIKFGNRVQHLFAGSIANATTVIQHAGDGANTYARFFGYIVNCNRHKKFLVAIGF